MRAVSLPASLCLAAALTAAGAGRGAGTSGTGTPAAGTPAAGTPVATGTPAAGSPTGSPMAAVWKEQQVEFVYMGRTSRYSCDGLRDKVRAMLIDLGARRDLRVVPLGCEDREGDDSGASTLKIVFSSPALPEAAAKPLHQGDLAATDARFERFTITSDAFRNMGVGDCELVQEFARQILPRMVVRDVREDILCARIQPTSAPSGGPRFVGPRFFVRGEVLRTLPRAEQRGGGQSAGGISR
jgi:hypothetical protein